MTVWIMKYGGSLFLYVLFEIYIGEFIKLETLKLWKFELYTFEYGRVYKLEKQTNTYILMF